MTLNDLERGNSPYFAFFPPNSTDFEADYITVVEDRPIRSVKYCLPCSLVLLAKTITHHAARSLLEMGKNPHCSGSVLFGFYDYQGSVRFGFLLSI